MNEAGILADTSISMSYLFDNESQNQTDFNLNWKKNIGSQLSRENTCWNNLVSFFPVNKEVISCMSRY